MAADVEAKALEKIQNKLKAAYPETQPLQKFEVKVDQTGGQVNVAHNQQGFRLANADQTDIVILDARNLTVARLAPYPGWEHLRDRANSAWQRWKAETPRHPIERIGVRFINRIDIPVMDDDSIAISNYLNFCPYAAPITDAAMLNFLLRVTVPTYDPQWIANITTTTLGATQVPKHHSLILDIDIFRTAEIPIRDDLLWPIIDAARLIKNDLFERCITAATRNLFSP